MNMNEKEIEKTQAEQDALDDFNDVLEAATKAKVDVSKEINKSASTVYYLKVSLRAKIELAKREGVRISEACAGGNEVDKDYVTRMILSRVSDLTGYKIQHGGSK